MVPETSDPLAVVVLGATGSVGRQALEVVAAYPERFRITGLAANTSSEAMAELVRLHRPEVAGMADPAAAGDLRGRLQGADGVRVMSGPACLEEMARSGGSDLVVAAMVGRSGLAPVMAAVEAGKRVALANKETLVMAGELIMATAAAHGASLLPVDSEHAAAHHLIRAAGPERVRRVVLTASGGPFLGRSRDELRTVTAREALAHPNWNMGAKISIDSATMMNKGFEVMEARWLFGMQPGRIDVVIHPESVVHALVETTDGAVLAHLSSPDMRVAIAHALAFPDMLDLPGQLPGFMPLDLAGLGRLSFEPASPGSFPALDLCRAALDAGGAAPAALSVADEVAVEAFLQGRIGFTDILAILSEVLDNVAPAPVNSLDDAIAAGDQGARLAGELVARRGGATS
jgi:1-deoxy-D-xylulose-5-phosphate reductoisomerase